MLLNLSPAIQEHILYLFPAETRCLAERELREIAQLPD